MGIFDKIKKEKRSLEVGTSVSGGDLLSALIKPDAITKEMAKEIPSVKASLDIIKNVVSSLPIKLYEKKSDDSVEELCDDERVSLLNDDTKGNLTGSQLKKAIIDNYLFGKGAYIYIDKAGNKINSLRFVDESDVSIIHNDDPIFKTYSILVRGLAYMPHEFVKILRNTTDGFTSKSIIDENQLILSLAYNELVFECNLVKKGGNKKGFLTSEKALSDEAVKSLRRAWNNMYSNSNENMLILNAGMQFKESANTSVEMQLNENKLTNSEEITMLFLLGNKIVRGNASQNDIDNFIKFCVVPILVDIEDALDRDLLLEKEKGKMYFAFDTGEISRGSFKERMEGYKIALDSNIMLLDEVRKKEDLPDLEFNYLKLGLDSVLYDLNNKTIYTPNTNAVQSMGGDANDDQGGENDEN